ncbi:glutathione S-transferase family protein [Qipengyuania sediminis]|uniref:glutathione S-transferase family protein n=1 Tax=Qipengyuania sediminis TaxID=1532023 RepID=UPI00105A0894|nr:glutathione S-transferase [Qipengyuania sediminis]
MITVHHLENSRSQRILWLLEELQLPYQVRRYERNKATMLAPPELRAVHPLGKSPAISHDGRVLIETGAIVEYLVELAGGKLGPPAEREEALRHRQFLHYAEGSAMPPLVIKLVLGRVPFFGKRAQARIQPWIDIHLDWLETEMAARAWFAGEAFTAADVMMSFPLEAARNRAGLSAQRHSNLTDFLARIHARPAYQAALAQGGPYAYA